MIGAASGCGAGSTTDLLGLRRALSRARSTTSFRRCSWSAGRALTVPAADIPGMNAGPYGSCEVRLMDARAGLRAAGIAIATGRRIITCSERLRVVERVPTHVRTPAHVRTRTHTLSHKGSTRARVNGPGAPECGCAKPTGSQPAEEISAADENRFEGRLFQAPFLQRSSSSTAASVMMRPPDFTSLLWNVLRCVS